MAIRLVLSVRRGKVVGAMIRCALLIAVPDLMAVQPSEISGLALWLKADTGVYTNASGVVTQWVDQVASIPFRNSSVSPAIPTVVSGWYNGTKALRFPTQPNYGLQGNAGSVSITNRQARTLFLVVDVTNAPSSNGEVFGAGTASMVDLSNGTLANRIRLRHSDSLFSPANSIPWTSPHIIGVRGTSAGDLAAYLDGDFLLAGATGEDRHKYFFYALTGALGVGWSTYGGRNYRGDLAEVVLYNRGLEDSEIRDVVEYLSARYDIPVTFGNAMPSPVVVNDQALIRCTPDTAYLAGNLTEGVIADVYAVWSTNGTLGNQWSGWIGTNCAPSSTLGAVYLQAANLLPGTTYYWRFYATNSGGYAWASTTNVFHTPAVVVVDAPPVTAGLALHLTAENVSYPDGSVLTWWPDRSGLCPPFTNLWGTGLAVYHAALAGLNDQPAVWFNRAAPLDSKVPSIPLNQDRTLFLVAVPSVLSNNEVWGVGTSAMLALEPPLVRIRATGNLRTADDTLTSAAHIVEVSDGSAQMPRTQVWIDGALQSLTYDAGYDETVRFFAHALNAAAYVGGTSYGASRSYRGYVAEIILYDRVLKEAEHHQMGLYLQQKYAIPGVYRAPQGSVFMIR